MAKQTPPVEKNERLTLNIEDLTHDGSGVGKVKGYPLFIPYALPGETITAHVVKVKKNFGFAKVIDVQAESPERVEPPCNVFYKCGGCQIQHMSYKMQLDMKYNQVKNAMHKMAHMSEVPVHSTIGMNDPWRYRNKISIPVGEHNGELVTGFYRQRSHDIITDMETCVVQDEINDRLQEAVRRIADKLGISAYDEQTDSGVLRHIMVRTGQSTNEAMIVLITRTEDIPHQDTLISELTETYPQIKSIIHNINNKQTNVILGDTTRVIWGGEYIYDSIGNIRFAISAKSFYQVNPAQTKVLYDKALEYANVGPKDTVIDAYCGIGTIGLFLARSARKVYGIDSVSEAISDAKTNAHLNHMDNVEFYVGEAETLMPWWQAQGLNPDVMVVDPPRKGCEETLLQTMITIQPKRIVYISCNPSTLARDLRILKDGGFETKEIQPVDMFPQSKHVECVALIEPEAT